jgi:2-dehydro-3-deoxyphosphogluconate aldolase / (4S)-4-hydroxy-2-oxoglutarate aldolase
MRFDRMSTLRKMLDVGAVPTFTPLDSEAARRVVRACSDAGAPVIEVMNRGEGTLVLFRDLVRWASLELPDVILGAGTIYDAPSAAMFIDAGANFIVSPILNRDVARLCNRRRVAHLPGCGTATEISDAEEFGAEIVKLFPAAAFDGPTFIRGIHGPNPMTRIMPTNVLANEQATRAWFAAGAACLGVGPHLISDDLQGAADPSEMTNRIRQYIGWVRASRSSDPRPT